MRLPHRVNRHLLKWHLLAEDDLGLQHRWQARVAGVQ